MLTPFGENDFSESWNVLFFPTRHLTLISDLGMTLTYFHTNKPFPMLAFSE